MSKWRFTAFGVLLLLAAAESQAQWSTITFNEANALTGVWFTSDTPGFVVGENKAMFRTTSGGSSFSSMSPPLGLDATKCCHSVRFRDSSVGWIGGTASVLRTTNGGSVWGGTQITVIGGSTTRYSIFGVSDTTAFQVGSLYRYILSLGGGSVSSSSWSSEGALRDIHMFDADNGIAVGPGGNIVRIGNAQATSPNLPTFSRIIAPTSNDLLGVTFPTPSVGYAVGANGAILKSDNGGSSWSLQSSGTTNRLADVHFRDANIGWAVGDAGLILVTVNGGASWSAEASGTSNDLRGVFATATNAYAVGARGTVLKRAPLSILLSTVAPDRGPTYGGTAATIRGSGFKSGARVAFGGIAATSVTVADANTITCVTPSHPPGSVDIVVTNSDNTTATLARGFLYQAGPHRRPARR